MSEQSEYRHSDNVGPISRRTLLALATGTGLGLLSEAYSMVLTPLVASTSVQRKLTPQIESQESTPVAASADIAKTYLPHAPWAAESANKIRIGTGESYIYFQERTTEDNPSQDGTAEENGSAFRFSPFAMVSFSEEGKEPLTVVANSAYIKLSAKLSLSTADSDKPLKVVTAALGGDVIVRGPEDMELRGKNFRFEEKSRRIWCDSDVAFRYGMNTGRAQGFQVGLVPVQRGSQKKQQLAAEDVETVQLNRNVEMNLKYRSEVETDEAATAWDVQIQSTGSCEFKKSESQVTFKRNVHVVGVEPDKPQADRQLHCDSLMIQFQKNESPAGDQVQVAVSGEADVVPADKEIVEKKKSAFPGSSSMRFHYLQADAATLPQSRVVVESLNDKLTARSRRLIYNAQTREIWLYGKDGVDVEQDTSLFNAPEIILSYDEGKISDALCRGAGWLKHFDKKTNELAFTARWSGHLKKFPDPETGWDIIELDQQALIQQPRERAALAADHIWLWYEELSSKDRRRLNRKQTLEPKRLVAQENVTLVSQEMSGETKQLEVWFDDGSEENPQQGNSLSQLIPVSLQRAETSHLRTRLRRMFPRRTVFSSDRTGQVFASVGDEGLIPGTGGQVPPQLRPDKGTTNNNVADTDSAEGRFNDPIEVKADLIHVRVAVADDDARTNQVAEVWTKGNVDVLQQPRDGNAPLQLMGERMHILNRDRNDQKMTLYGSPAQIRRGQMVIQGNEVVLDRGANDSSVNGAGSISFPVSQSLEGKKLTTPQVLNVKWQQKMTFDGKIAEFTGNVKADLQESHLYCLYMQVALKNRISFSDTDQNALGDDKAAIDTVKCTGRVSFHSLSYNEKNQLAEVRKGSFEEFALNQTTDRITARGAQNVPGYFISWGRGSGRGPGISGIKKANANQSADPEAKGWEYRRVQFAGEMVGSVNHRTGVFSDDVLVVFGPVKDPKQTIDPDDLPDNGARMTCQELQVELVRQNEQDEGHIELIARENARVEANQYHALSHIITFDESKDQYTLRGDAQLSYQKSVGAESIPFQGKEIFFIPSLKQLKVDGFFKSTIISQ